MARAIASYEDTLAGTRFEICIMQDYPSWPVACNEGFLQAKGDVLHFSADDLEAVPGWDLAALLHLSVHNELPAPRVFDYKPESEGGHWNNHKDGADGAVTDFTRVPILTRDQYEKIGPWPALDYYADTWLSAKARTLGIATRMVYGYDFVHHWHQHGRVDSTETLQRAWKEYTRLEEAM